MLLIITCHFLFSCSIVNNFFAPRIAALGQAHYAAPVPTRFTVLGSGSGGNASFIETDQTRLLVDAGLSGRQIRLRLGQLLMVAAVAQ